MKLKPLATLMMTFALSACSGLPEQAFNTDLNSNTCCTQLKELPLIKLTVPFQQRVVMDGDQPTVPSSLINVANNQSDQRLPTMAYRIDNNQQAAFSLLVRSYIDNNALFAPSIIVFDANWKQVAYYQSEQFSYQPSGMQGLERIQTTISINPQIDNAHYIVIMPDTSVLNETIKRIRLEELYAKSQQIIGNKQLPLTATFEKIGVIDVAASTSNNNAVLTLLAELGSSTSSQSEDAAIVSSEETTPESWSHYQTKIDQALANGDIKKAASLANQASQQGMPQAKDYLLKQLAK
jgi:maltose operon periplasmic protein